MTKNEFVAFISKKTGMKPGEAAKILMAFLDSIEDALARDKRIVVPGLGAFNVYKRAPRRGRNLVTGENLDIEESSALRYAAAKSLKELINSDKPKPDSTYFKIF